MIKRYKFVFSFFYLIILFCSADVSPAFQNGNVIYADDPGIVYTGRLNMDNPKAPVMYWPGTSVSARFYGTSIKMILKDSTGENYYNVIIDNNNSDKPVVINCRKDVEVYEIASGLNDGIHKITVFKRTEIFEGSTRFRGFILDRGKTLADPPFKQSRRIEFYGNSITSGMGNECTEADSQNNKSKKNNYLAYGAITARNLDAEYVCISKSGIGILISWYPQIMPEIYSRINPDDPGSRWDFSKWTPDVVVVNIFQNDSWLIKRLNPVPGEKEIVEAYISFISTIRSRYPDSQIICALGSMDAAKKGSPWPGYVKKAVEEMKKYSGDSKLNYCIFPYDGPGVHPTVPQHKKMAGQLTTFIKKITGWK